MHIVVTGASGNVGTALLRRLAADPDGPRVLGIARRPPVSAGYPYHAADWLACDVGDPDAADRLAAAFRGAAAVVHLAWSIQGRRDDVPMRRTNIAGTENVIAAVRAAAVPHLVCASSIAAYSPHRRRNQRVSEDWTRGGVPGSAYSLQKAGLERRLDRLQAEQPGLTVARIRPGAIVSEDAAGQLARYMLGALVPAGLVGRVPVPLAARPGTRFQLVHADDVAAAVATIVARRAAGAFNLATEPVITMPELAAILHARLIPAPLTLLQALAWPTWRLGLQPVHPGWLELMWRVPLIDTGRARKVLDWRPRRDGREALRALIAAIRRGEGTASPPLRPTAELPRGLRGRLRATGSQSHAP